ncbi:MAG: hypothetical protein RL093_621, partial [Pseudomonadota bacterium]
MDELFHTSQPFNGRNTPRQPMTSSGMVTTICTQIGGWTANSNHMNRAIPTIPTAL